MPDLTPEPRIPIGVDSSLQRERARALLRGIDRGPTRNATSNVRTDPGGPRAKRRQRLARGLVGGTLFVVVAVGALYWIQTHRRQQIPLEATTALSSALAMLRKDDGPSLAQAVILFSQLAEAYPAYMDAKANRLLALALQLDNGELEQGRLRGEAEAKTRLKSKIETTQSPADWQSRANALREEIEARQKKLGLLEKELEGLRTKISSLMQEFDSRPGDEELPVLRARIVTLGVRGDAQVIRLAERYRIKGGTDGWGTIALAEYAVNTRATPGTVAQIRTELESLRKQDAAFMRAHVLAARLAMVQKQFEQAADTLEVVVTMNPSHELALSLRGQARQHTNRANP